MFALFTLERRTIPELIPSLTKRGAEFALFSSHLMFQKSLNCFKATKDSKILKNGSKGCIWSKMYFHGSNWLKRFKMAQYIKTAFKLFEMLQIGYN